MSYWIYIFMRLQSISSGNLTYRNVFKAAGIAAKQFNVRISAVYGVLSDEGNFAKHLEIN